MKKIVLITGSNGLIGSESSLFFLKKNFIVLGIDNNERRSFFGKDGDTQWIKKKLNYYKNYHHFNFNITNYLKLISLFKKYNNKISLIIHSAAQPSHDWAYQNPIKDFNINAAATLNLLELTKKYNSKAKFIFMSTNKVYGDGPNYLPLVERKLRWDFLRSNKKFKGIDESMSLDNVIHSLFGISKCYADLAVQEYGKNFGLKTVVFRAGCITGPNHSGAKLHGFLSYLVKAILKTKSYTLIGYNGKQVRDNLHSHDLVNCFWEFYKSSKKKGEVYNIGGGRFSNCSILEAIDYVEKKLNIKVKKTFLMNARVGDHKWYISDNSKFKKDFPNWKQKYSLSKIIDEIINVINKY